MTLEMVLRCQGNNGRCTASFARICTNARDIRSAARAKGWRCAYEGSRDLCPLCAAARAVVADLHAPGTCLGCYRGPKLEFRDSLGHDRLGHQVGNLLARESVTTWDKLHTLTMTAMFDMNGLGDSGIARIRWAQEHPGEDFPV